jgi:hypothetical protein
VNGFLSHRYGGSCTAASQQYNCWRNFSKTGTRADFVEERLRSGAMEAEIGTTIDPVSLIHSEKKKENGQQSLFLVDRFAAVNRLRREEHRGASQFLRARQGR